MSEDLRKMIKIQTSVSTNSYKKNRNRIEALESEVKDLKGQIEDLKELCYRIDKRMTYVGSKAA